jgi:RNA polymerase sigma-70 factor (ECF subfamily)
LRPVAFRATSFDVGVDREQLERAIRQLCDAASWGEAATCAIEGYGPELLGFLYAALGDEDDARDGFSIFSESLFVNLPRFRWQCQFRTWAYALARSAMGRVLRDPRRADRHVAISDVPEPELQAQIEARTVTLPFLKSDVKARVRSLRASLAPEDQALLSLRVDRGMAWRDVALVMAGADADETALAREAAALRKRFERIKQRIRALAPVPTA